MIRITPKEAVTILLCIMLFTIIFGVYPEFPLKGKLASATIIKYRINYEVDSASRREADPIVMEATVVVTNRSDLQKIERDLRVVWNSFASRDSMDGNPRYKMKVKYLDGQQKDLIFTETEWSGTGRTPKRLVATIEAIIKK